ncbi:Membrane-bound O-acyltransferase domain-containing protein 2 [Operophtera brumata]|uniref:Membrane-bound O-acyltransferase domain-containing protein 2 n=1 Tax=Operophtera brumata TaxID=104452 RepID=A0A0L7LP34_OPEBR|nr:Membrane-bound O-acyltransferase domain-containing protein 2 [Operophtera brumata]
MTTAYFDHYDGSKVFQFLSTRVGLPLDLVNFLIAQVAALCLARLFRKPLKFASPEFRHSVCLAIGLLMGYFCFGNINISAACVRRTITMNESLAQDVRAIRDRDNLTNKEVNANTKGTVDSLDTVQRLPSPLEYFAYTLAFQTLMCGPVVFYNDYINFIEGEQWPGNTNAWLRNVAYQRGGARLRTVRVYGLSAVWHGFHPGYYMTFFAGGLFTVAARKFRTAARPLFVNSRPKKLFYDLLSFITTRVAMTFITTRVAMTYATVPFVLLHLTPSLAFYGCM